MQISEIIERVKELTKDAPEPKPVCWLEHDEHGDSECEFCPDCAEEVYESLVAGEAVDVLSRWISCTEDNIRVCQYVGSYESDGCALCASCGCQLDVSLTNYGVRSETDHFQEYGITTPDDYRHWLDVLNAIDYVEAKGFPSQWMTTNEAIEAQRLYTNVVELSEKYLVAA